MARTIYQPVNLNPENRSIDMSVEQVFTCEVNGLKITDYQLIIYDITDNSVLYDTGKVNLGANLLFNSDTLEITIPASTIADGLQLKWTVEYWNDTEHAISFETFFISASTPTFVLDVPALVEQKKLTVSGVYTQAEGVSLREWVVDLFDMQDNLIATSGVSGSGFIEHTFDGLLSGKEYKIVGKVITIQNVVVISDDYIFDVVYDFPIFNIKPEVTFNPEAIALDVEFSDSVQIIGETAGTTSYVEDFIYEGNYGLRLQEGANVEFEVEIPEDFTAHLVVRFADLFGFEGEILRLENDETNDYFIVGYEGGRFYKEVTTGEKTFSIIAPLTDSYFLITIRQNNVRIYEWVVFLGNTHFYLQSNNFTHQQLGNYTHQFIATNNFEGTDIIFVSNIYNI